MPRKNPAITEETLATGMLSSSPAVPEEDLDTIGLQWLLVAQSRLSTATVADLARVIYENKAELALDDGFASRIEPAAPTRTPSSSRIRAPPNTSTTTPSRSSTATAT